MRLNFVWHVLRHERVKAGRKWHGECRTGLLFHKSGCANHPEKPRPLAASTRSIASPRSPLVRNVLLGTSFALKVVLMRFRAGIGQKRRKERRQTLALIVVIACVPVMGTVLTVVLTTELDLSDLVPSNKQIGDYVILDWSGLRQVRPDPLNSASVSLSGTSVRALGYMIDGNSAAHTGDLVRDFFLLPDAGNLLHPAHRFGDQMIGVHLREGDRVPFSPRRLVWVWGTFRAAPGDPSGPTPLYYLESAQTQIADRTDIGRYFQ
jgi:hypothetical protein